MLNFFLFLFRNILISITMILAPCFFFFFIEILISFTCYFFQVFFCFFILFLSFLNVDNINFKNCMKSLKFVLNTIFLFSNYSWIVFIDFSKHFHEYYKNGKSESQNILKLLKKVFWIVFIIFSKNLCEYITTEDSNYKITWNYSKKMLDLF